MGVDTRERSGTPVETRSGTEAAGRGLGDVFRGPRGRPADFDQVVSRIGTPLQRLGSQAQMNLLGFDPRMLNIGEAAEGILADPASRTEGLFASLEPFEERQRERALATTRESFGTAGGRFSRNLLEAQTEQQGELARQFRRSREQALLEAQGQRIQGMDAVSRALLAAGQQGSQMGLEGLRQLLTFFQPGAPVIEQGGGFLPALLQAGTTLGGAALLGGGGGGAAAGAANLLDFLPGAGGGGTREPERVGTAPPNRGA